MTDENNQEHWQYTLETYGGVPTNQAIAAAEVLQKQHEDPFYELTEEDLHAKQSAWQWMNAEPETFEPYCSCDEVGFPEGQLFGYLPDEEIAEVSAAYHLGEPIPELGGDPDRLRRLEEISTYGRYSDYSSNYNFDDGEDYGQATECI